MGEEEREKQKREERIQKRKEVEPVIPRTCGHGPLVAPRPSAPYRNGISISRLASAPPLSQNPAYAPAMPPLRSRNFTLHTGLCQEKVLEWRSILPTKVGPAHF